MHRGIWYARQHLEGPSEIDLILPWKHKTADRQVRRRQCLYIRTAAVTSAHDSPISESRKLLRPCLREATFSDAQAARAEVAVRNHGRPVRITSALGIQQGRLAIHLAGTKRIRTILSRPPEVAAPFIWTVMLSALFLSPIGRK